MARKAPFVAAAGLGACLLWLGLRPVEAPPTPEAPLAPSASVEPARLMISPPDDAPADAAAPDEQAGIEVKVIDAAGRPASGATVLAVGPGLWPARKTETAEDGRARIPGLDRGVYDLRATRGDDVVIAPVTVLLSRAETEKVTLRLVKGRQVRVRVLDAESDSPVPVPSANVVLAEGGLSPFPLEAMTDKQGIAVLGPVAPVTATVSAHATGFVARTGVSVPASGAAEVEVALVRGGTLTGEVVDARGRAIEGARIEVVGTDLSGAPVAETSDTLAFRAAHFSFALAGPRPLLPAGELGVLPGRIPDIPRGPSVMPPLPVPKAGDKSEAWVSLGDGTFRAHPVSPGRLRVIARHPEYVEAISDTVRLSPGGDARVKLTMRGGGSLAARVVDERGDAVAGARVEVVALRGSFAATLATADDGSFSLSALPERLAITVIRRGSADTAAHREQVNVKEGERKQIEIKLPAPREPVRVRVTDERSRPLPNAQVSVASLSPKAPLRRTRFTSEAGDAEFTDARGLPLRIEVTLPGRAPVVMQLDVAPAEVALELTRGVTVKGAVTTRRGHDPLPGAEVTLQTATSLRRARSDEEGNFQFEDIAAGPAKLLVTHRGHASVERQVTIVMPARDEPQKLESIDLAEAGSVEGEVIDEKGKPVAGARVAKDAVPAYVPGGRLQAGMALTDRHGKFRLDDLPEGAVTLEAFDPDRGRGKVEVKVTAGRTTDRVKLVLEAGDASKSEEAPASFGVAVTLGERDVEDGVYVIVVLVTPGSEAERAGLLRGDRIVSIDGEVPTSMRDARSRLNGPLGNDVIVNVERDDGRHTLRVTREPVER